ncbi:MAG: SigE family RNA polymerase sigma factor [Actinomycetota bacterium]|nr:SigE family RNA polymerase sigma factor [Actinomycetota bacterium]
METAISVSTRRARFEELYVTHAPDALRIAYLLVGDRAQAEDIVQDAFVRVFGRFGELRKPESFRTYLMRAVVNLAKNYFRRRSVERKHANSAGAAISSNPERDDDLLDALKKLPDRQRAALVLRYCEDLSEHDTAEILQTSIKAVKSLVTRGLAALREMEEVTR